MIETLASPSVCVIDDEELDYRPIRDALDGLYVSSIHILGNDLSKLPDKPFGSLRLVLTDLHLNGAEGKTAAAHTANVFCKLVSVGTAPVVVIIWSKYANDAVATADLVDDEMETEAMLFKRTLLEAEPAYRDRLIFLEMAKPKADRAYDWVEVLKEQLKDALQGLEAIQELWSWESFVRDAAIGTSEELTAMAANVAAKEPGVELEPGLRLVMQMLTGAQGEADLSAASAPRHLASAFSQLLVDRLEHASLNLPSSPHLNWLADKPASSVAGLGPALNGRLLTSAVSEGDPVFSPGTVYTFQGDEEFKALFGVKVGDLVYSCFSKRRHDEAVGVEDRKKRDREECNYWKQEAKPVLVEISPACDVAQGTRRCASLIAGVLLPLEAIHNAKNEGAFQSLPAFYLRWSIETYAERDSVLVLCCRFKTTLPATEEPAYLRRWFRLRDLPTASLRNWHSGQASRVGYVSVRH